MNSLPSFSDTLNEASIYTHQLICPIFTIPPSIRDVKLTLLLSLLTAIHLTPSGFRSFPNTLQPFLAAGIAKGPTPAITSAITSPGLKRDTNRLCSFWSREFQ